MVFGPAYKGIPLAATVAVELARLGPQCALCLQPQGEAKDHGEGGTLVGAPLRGRVLIVDDVMSAGTAARESIALIRSRRRHAPCRGHCAGPPGKSHREWWDVPYSAVQYVREQLGLKVCAIATLADLLLYLSHHGDGEMAPHHERCWPTASVTVSTEG